MTTPITAASAVAIAAIYNIVIFFDPVRSSAAEPALFTILHYIYLRVQASWPDLGTKPIVTAII